MKFIFLASGNKKSSLKIGKIWLDLFSIGLCLSKRFAFWNSRRISTFHFKLTPGKTMAIVK